MINRSTFPMSAFTSESFASVHLEITNAYNIRIGCGTGFIGKFGKRYYLITALHVLLGISDPSSLHTQSSSSMFIDTNCFLLSIDKDRGVLENRPISINLYSADRTRNWNQLFDWDVATIDITDKVRAEDRTPISIDLSEVSAQVDAAGNTIGVSADEDLPSVGGDVFIVGYPGNMSYLTNNDMPLWKRASIASEPHLALDGRPILLVDTQGASGLSGSPVLFNGPSLVSPSGRRRTRESHNNTYHVIGIYCGREGFSPDAISLSMGRVFKKLAIQHTIMEDKRT